jgi:hypothetical protein
MKEKRNYYIVFLSHLQEMRAENIVGSNWLGNFPQNWDRFLSTFNDKIQFQE